ncbi:MAG: hypothetical protein WBJ87_08525 [Candidatus Hydrothermia bacterium]
MKIDLYNVDSLEYIKSLPAKSIDAIIDKEYFEIAKQQLQEEPLIQEAI